MSRNLYGVGTLTSDITCLALGSWVSVFQFPFQLELQPWSKGHTPFSWRLGRYYASWKHSELERRESLTLMGTADFLESVFTVCSDPPHCARSVSALLVPLVPVTWRIFCRRVSSFKVEFNKIKKYHYFLLVKILSKSGALSTARLSFLRATLETCYNLRYQASFDHSRLRKFILTKSKVIKPCCYLFLINTTYVKVICCNSMNIQYLLNYFIPLIINL